MYIYIFIYEYDQHSQWEVSAFIAQSNTAIIL